MHEFITDNLDLWTSAMLNKTNGGGGTNGKPDAYGIKKLRELILELAVRGKLVPQDPKDEPASALLPRVLEENAQLPQKRSKKPSESPEIIDDEISFELPQGWEYVRNGSLFSLRKGKKPKNISESQIGLPYLDIEALDRGNIHRFTDDDTCPRATEEDILVVCDGSRSGLILDGKNGVIGSTLAIIDTPRTIQPFVKLMFMEAYERLNSTMKGAAIPHLDTNRLMLEIVGLPPLEEQHRIVAKVDELMVMCDQLEQQQSHSIEAHRILVENLLDTLTDVSSQQELTEAWTRIANHFDTLFTTEHSVDQLKQTILRLAVMGKLVPQDPADEPASVLREKISNEKARLADEGKIKRQTPLPEIGDTEKPFGLPSGWAWARLQDVIDVRDGTHDSPKDALGPDTYPLVTSKNFVNGEIDFAGARRISSKDHFEIAKRSAVEKYDILFSMIGGNLGNQVMVKDERQFSVKNVALFKYYSKALISPFFVKRCMEHLALGLQEKAIGGAQPFVSLGFLRNLVFALPPIGEQHRIVAKVDELTALCADLETRVKAAQTTQISLADAVVEQAVA